MVKKVTTEDFIKNAKLIHGSDYNYSKVKYIEAKSKVKIICNLCKNTFLQTPNQHISSKNGCPTCAFKNRYTTKIFIEKAIKIHKNKYDYSLVNYIDHDIKVIIICKACGLKFKKTSQSHINMRSGCNNCSKLKSSKNRCKLNDKFIKQAKIKNDNKFDYSKTNYINSKTNIIVICKKCNYEFTILPNNHLQGRKCVRCNYRVSKPEKAWLKSLKIKNLKLQHRINIDNKLYIVDGFDSVTNTIYEFYGDYYHGNPKVFDRDKLNTKTNLTYGELYDRSLERENKLIEFGYKIIVMWEFDWKNKIKE